MQFARNDIQVTVTLPKEHRSYFTSKSDMMKQKQ